MKEIEYFLSSTRFRFGDGRQVTAIKRVVFPAVITGKHCKINAEIVKENILLLLSKQWLKKFQEVEDILIKLQSLVTRLIYIFQLMGIIV